MKSKQGERDSVRNVLGDNAREVKGLNPPPRLRRTPEVRNAVTEASTSKLLLPLGTVVLRNRCSKLAAMNVCSLVNTNSFDKNPGSYTKGFSPRYIRVSGREKYLSRKDT